MASSHHSSPNRVSLRQWQDGDLEPFAALGRDAEVMRYFPAPLTREQSDTVALRQRDLIDQRGWGFWVVDVDGVFAGFTGLAIPNFDAPFNPCVEIGWRLARQFWGQGIADRAALLALDYAFTTLKLTEVVSFTAEVNTRSRRLMERLGFTRDPQGDFMHPKIPEGHELRSHVLYRKQVNCTFGSIVGG
jgi:RimJ/RimL family protein N-acetyltransferase